MPPSGTPADEAWPTWTPLGKPNGTQVLDVAAAPRAREFAHLFALAHASTTHEPPIGLAGDLWHHWQVTPDTWSIWQPLGHPGHAAGPPVVATNGDDRLEVFTIDGDTGRIWHRSQLNAIDPQALATGPQSPTMALGSARPLRNSTAPAGWCSSLVRSAATCGPPLRQLGALGSMRRGQSWPRCRRSSIRDWTKGCLA